MPTHILTLSLVKAMKEQFEAEIAELAAPVDDPVYVDLAGKYMGAILYDYETRATWKLYRVTAIQFARSYARHRPSCWEATCEPVYRDAETGQFLVPADQRISGSTVLKTTALQGYALAEYRDGIDNVPTYLPWVEQYVANFRDVILPRYSSLFSTEESPASKEKNADTRPSRRRKRPSQSTAPTANHSRTHRSCRKNS